MELDHTSKVISVHMNKPRKYFIASQQIAVKSTLL